MIQIPLLIMNNHVWNNKMGKKPNNDFFGETCKFHHL
jgi:hypothetical protein